MLVVRVTKYNPLHRDAAGRFTAEDWTSISDIGKTFAGKVLTVQKYLEVEDWYAQVVSNLMIAQNLDALKVSDLENEQRTSHIPDELKHVSLEMAADIKEGSILNRNEVTNAVKLVLREVIWCRLAGEQGVYVHFGHDYYMYVGCDQMALPDLKVPSGLFAEDYESPYATGGS